MSNEVSTAPPEALPKKMRWFDGFAMSMTMPAALIATLGASISGLGGWGAAVLWAISMILAMGVNWLYTELATMFPNSSGGIADYAAKAWKSRAPWVAPLAGVGYWLPWGTNLATYGAVTGALVQAQWFPEADWAVSFGPIHLSFPIVVGLGVIVLLWGINAIGVRMAMSFVYVTAALLMIPLFVFIVLPLFSGDWQPGELTWRLAGGWEGLRTALVWMYIMAWTTFGIEVCATFAPEYKNSVKDTTRAIKAAVLFCLGVFFLIPITLGGYAGEAAIDEDPAAFFVGAFGNLVGGASDFMVICLIASLILIMTTSVADASRVLYNMGREHVTVPAVGKLDRRGIPMRSLNVMLVMNILVLVVLQSPLAIIVTGNLGYILTHILAISGYWLLRKDKPNAVRPIKLPRFFTPLSLVLALVLTLILVVGATGFSITGYGGVKELVIALGVLAAGVIIWAIVRKRDQASGWVSPSEAEESADAH